MCARTKAESNNGRCSTSWKMAVYLTIIISVYLNWRYLLHGRPGQSLHWCMYSLTVFLAAVATALQANDVRVGRKHQIVVVVIPKMEFGRWQTHINSILLLLWLILLLWSVPVAIFVWKSFTITRPFQICFPFILISTNIIKMKFKYEHTKCF